MEKILRLKATLDLLHYNLSKICSFNKVYNFIISAREAGKTTAIWLHLWKKFIELGKTFILIRRRKVNINPTYITDSLKVLSKFREDFDMNKIYFKHGDCKSGLVDVYYDGQIFFRVIALSSALSDLKGLILFNLYGFVFDEFICNIRKHERYIDDEVTSFRELYKTFSRECETVPKVFFLGNPYSLFNPYFSWLQVNTTLLKPGAFIVGNNYVIECYKLSDELIAEIRKHDPLYEFDDAYTRYAFNGEAINDTNIRKSNQHPPNYKLLYAFRIAGKMLGIYLNNDILDFSNKYYVDYVEELSSRKKMWCFDFDDLMDHTILFSNEENTSFKNLKRAFRNRQIVFKNEECYYLLEEVYSQL